MKPPFLTSNILCHFTQHVNVTNTPCPKIRDDELSSDGATEALRRDRWAFPVGSCHFTRYPFVGPSCLQPMLKPLDATVVTFWEKVMLMEEIMHQLDRFIYIMYTCIEYRYTEFHTSQISGFLPSTVGPWVHQRLSWWKPCTLWNRSDALGRENLLDSLMLFKKRPRVGETPKKWSVNICDNKVFLQICWTSWNSEEWEKHRETNDSLQDWTPTQRIAQWWSLWWWYFLMEFARYKHLVYTDKP